MHCTTARPRPLVTWRVALTAALSLVVGSHLLAHDPSAAPITWNREVSRIVYERCASCHREGGTAFSLMTYQEAQPRAAAIKEAVLSRRMPPWGAVKGFGSFRNDGGLTQEQISLIADWVEGGATRGNNPNALPQPPKFDTPAPFVIPPGAIRVSGEHTLRQSIVLDGLFPVHVPPGRSFQTVAALPGGGVEPLLWLYEYRDAFRHPFLFRKPITLPAGTTIRGVPREVTILLIPVQRPR